MALFAFAVALAAQLVRAADECDVGDEDAAEKYSRDANLKTKWKSYLRLIEEAEAASGQQECDASQECPCYDHLIDKDLEPFPTIRYFT